MSRELPPCDHDECPPTHCKRPAHSLHRDGYAAGPPRYDHKCKRCGDDFSNIVKDCDYCCVCEIRNQRDEWD